jgi:hypothetical protein
MDRKQRGETIHRKGRSLRSIALLATALLASSPAWAATFIVSSGSKVTLNGNSQLILQGTNELQLSYDGAITQNNGSTVSLSGTNTLPNASNIDQQGGTGSLEVSGVTTFSSALTLDNLVVSGSATLEGNTTLQTLHLTGGATGSPTVVTLKESVAALTINTGGAITSDNSTYNWIFNNKNLITQNIGDDDTDVLYPIGTGITDNNSRAINVKSTVTTGSGGTVAIRAASAPKDPSLEVFTLVSNVDSRSFTITGLFENFTNNTTTDDSIIVSSVPQAQSVYVRDLDSIAPLGGTVSVNNNDTTAYKTSVSVAFSGTDTVGITAYAIIESNQDGTVPTPTDSDFTGLGTNVYEKNLSVEKNVTLSSGDGTKELNIFFKDSAGNISTAISDSIALNEDNEAPQAPSVAFGGSFLTSANLTGSAVTLSLAATDDTGVSAYYLTDNASFTPDANDPAWDNITMAATYSDNVSFTLADASNAGSRNVYAFFKDDAGNVSEGASASTTLDLSAPTGASISLKDGVDNTTVQGITALIGANDDTGVIGYYLTENTSVPSVGDTGWTAVSSTNYSDNVSFTLSAGEGTKTVYVHFKDGAGQISSTSDTITFAIPGVSIDNGTVTFGDVVLTVPQDAVVSEPDADGKVTISKTTSSGGTSSAVVAADGSATSTVTTAGGATTTVSALADSTIIVAADGAITAIMPASSNGGNTLSLTSNADGTVTNQSIGAGGKTTEVKVPAGSTVTPKSTGSVNNSSPVTTAAGKSTTLETTIDPLGITEVEFTDPNDNSTVIILPVPAGFPVEVNSNGQVTATFDLRQLAAKNMRFTAASETSETLFLGRYLGGAPVLIEPTLDTELTLTRNPDSEYTSWTLQDGQANLYIGDRKEAYQGTVRVTNSAVPVNLAAGSNFVAGGVQRSITDLEKFDNVHSVWVWDSSAGSWLAYSATANLSSVANSLTSVDYKGGMFVYSTTTGTINLADGQDMNLATELASETLSSGWHFRSNGNQNSTVDSVLKANSAIQSLWVREGSSWKVYATNAELVAQIREKSYTLMSATDTLSAKGTVWIYSSGSSSSRTLRTPPQ